MKFRCQVLQHGERCESEAVTCLTIGCEHEHIDSNLVCSGCLILVRVQIGIQEFYCTPCEESSLPHRCHISEIAENRLSERADNNYSVKLDGDSE